MFPLTTHLNVIYHKQVLNIYPGPLLHPAHEPFDGIATLVIMWLFQYS